MNISLLNLSGQDIDDNPIVLESYVRDSDASYFAENNDDKVFYCCEPDKDDEVNNSKHEPDPRCDYLLVGRTDNSVRYIELKGTDKSSGSQKCCVSTWAHAFHQLFISYAAYSICYEDNDKFELILCTSIPEDARKGRATNYTKYKYYKSILNQFGYPPKVLYRGDVDIV